MIGWKHHRGCFKREFWYGTKDAVIIIEAIFSNEQKKNDDFFLGYIR